MNILPRSFYDRPTLTVARELIGTRLVRISDGVKLVGLITETEAYISEKDLACHCKAGRTPRTAVMFEEPGHAYVYFTYGNHWMFNIVTERVGFPAAVLIRAIQPVDGVDVMMTIVKPAHVTRTHRTLKACSRRHVDGQVSREDDGRKPSP